MRSCKPPDPNTHQPRYTPPPGACDAHCHVFGPANRFAYAPGRKYTPPDAPRERLAALHRKLGIERAVIVQASCHGADNRAMLDAIAASDGHYRGVCNANAAFDTQQFEALHEGGVRGLRFNFVRHLGGAPDLDAMRALVDRVAHLPWHVELHFDAADLLQYQALIESLPIPVVLDHMGRVPVAEGVGQKPFQNLLAQFRVNPNLWIKISGSERISAAGPPFEDAIPFARALIDSAAERILWGTDWPHPNIAGTMPNDGDLVDLFAAMVDDDACRRQILVDNPARLFGF